MTEGDEDGAIEHRALLADEPVCDPAPGERQEIHEAHVQRVDARRLLVVQGEAAAVVDDRVAEIEDEHGPEAVVAEALEGFREEEVHQPQGMPEQGASLGGGCVGHGLIPEPQMDAGRWRSIPVFRGPSQQKTGLETLGVALAAVGISALLVEAVRILPVQGRGEVQLAYAPLPEPGLAGCQ